MTSSTSHRLGGSNGIAMDSPLKDVSANLRDMKLGASPIKGSSLKAGPGRLGLSRKDRLDSVPSSSADFKVGITRDWQGPDKALKPKVSASISVGSSRQRSDSRLLLRSGQADHYSHLGSLHKL